MASRLSSEQTELETKLERNRAAFEAWLERKKEAQKVHRDHKFDLKYLSLICFRKLLRKKGRLLS